MLLGGYLSLSKMYNYGKLYLALNMVYTSLTPEVQAKKFNLGHF